MFLTAPSNLIKRIKIVERSYIFLFLSFADSFFMYNLTISRQVTFSLENTF